MEWLNYHHLFYFWVVAREGSLTDASKALRVSQATLSTQIKALETRLGEALFTRTKGRLILTPTGRRVADYASEIFGLGRQMLDDVATGQSTRRLRTFSVGITEAVPKLIVRKLLEPALRLEPRMKLVCREGDHTTLQADLARGAIDLVIADAPMPPGSSVKAFTHVLGESGIGWFATTSLIAQYPQAFPECFAEMPVLLPLAGTPLRRDVDQWFDEHQLRPTVVGEFQDSALLKVFGGDSLGAFPAPIAVEAELAKRYDAKLLGIMDGITARLFAISVDRVIRHPAIAAIAGAARKVTGAA